MPIDPIVIEYLKRKKNPYRMREDDTPFYADPQFTSALTRSMAQLGTLGGKTPDTSPVQDYSNYLTARKNRDEERARNEIEWDSSLKDKIFSEQMKMKEREELQNQNKIRFEEEKRRKEEDREIKRQELEAKREDREFNRQMARERNDILKSQMQERKDKSKNNESAKESKYRYNILTRNANQLRDLIQKHGTFDFFGPESKRKENLLYQMAVDFAKLVDPPSVAREGEVEASKKYMLDTGGITSKSTALSSIDSYIEDLDERLKARNEAYGLEPIQKEEIIIETPIEKLKIRKPGDIVIFKGNKYKVGDDLGLDPI